MGIWVRGARCGFSILYLSRLVDVIDWIEAPGMLAWRNPIKSSTLKNGAQLNVREGNPV